MNDNGRPQAIRTTSTPEPGVIEVRFPFDFQPHDGAVFRLHLIAERAYELRLVTENDRAVEQAIKRLEARTESLKGKE